MNQQNPNPDEMLIPDKCTRKRCNDCPIYFDCLSYMLEDNIYNVDDLFTVDPDLFYDIML